MNDSSASGREIREEYAHKYAILEINTTDFEGFEELRDGLPIWLRIDSSSRRWILMRCEERHTGCRIVIFARHGRENGYFTE